MRERSKYGMPPPKTRREFEHNLFLLVEETNRILASDEKDIIRNFLWATYPHIKGIRNHPNGRINFLTVNEQARLQANMKKWMSRNNY
ncbi:hypothetical protein RM553_02165 [Zunongwangia sp. F363]|uniref:Uncharacterized protein n=1 Tax=Autumnicola tepida TaxID=3075595 RepID=A0ABU3C5L4_9FLAO|nr:hypothetical protein [Zunongwangia sp. F363]MDT0641626.1 hypothetical protein [Zunongwangia sp. F363]